MTTASSSPTPTTTIALSSHITGPLQTTSTVSSTPAVQTKSSGASVETVTGLCYTLMVAITLYYSLL
jgi:hypothetical protein